MLPAIQSLKGKLRRDWVLAIAFGFVVLLAMLGLYFAVLLPSGGMEQAKREGVAKLESLGIGSPAALLLVAAFYAFLHSGFEEFYWRGFLFQGLRQYCPMLVALIISSLGFMAHHVLVLGKFFGYDSVYTYFFSLSIAIGGGVWAWLVSRTESLIPSWISHGIIDAAIFLIALHLIFFAS
jgi:membrane protease YdiL (CAAX protease family)